MNTQDQNESAILYVPMRKAYTPFASLDARYSHIAAVCGVRERGALVPQAGDVAEEVKLVSSVENDESILESEYNYQPSVELVSRLGDKDSLIEARQNSAHSDAADVTTPSERAQIRQDLWARASETYWRASHPVEMWLAPVELFSNHEARLTA